MLDILAMLSNISSNCFSFKLEIESIFKVLTSFPDFSISNRLLSLNPNKSEGQIFVFLKGLWMKSK